MKLQRIFGDALAIILGIVIGIIAWNIEAFFDEDK